VFTRYYCIILTSKFLVVMKIMAKLWGSLLLGHPANQANNEQANRIEIFKKESIQTAICAALLDKHITEVWRGAAASSISSATSAVSMVARPTKDAVLAWLPATHCLFPLGRPVGRLFRWAGLGDTVNRDGLAACQIGLRVATVDSGRLKQSPFSAANPP